ncbi:hypothetical protein ABZ912_57185 [Nonomuraea angiospora]
MSDEHVADPHSTVHVNAIPTQHDRLRDTEAGGTVNASRSVTAV